MAALTETGCDCCSMAALPHSLLSLIDQCTDVDTDSRDADALPSSSSWPLYLRESIWKDRLTFRQLLKARTPALLSSTSHPSFLTFLTSLPPHHLSSLFSFTIPHLHQLLRSSFPFNPPFLSLLHALLTQLLRFPATHYPPALDACTEGELELVGAMRGEVVGGEEGARLVVEERWLREGGLEGRVRELRGKLLVRRRKVVGEGNEGEGGGGEGDGRARVGERFRNDRRLLRLCIFRFGLERAVELFNEQHAT